MRQALLLAIVLATGAWTEVPEADRLQLTPEEQHTFLSSCAAGSSVVNAIKELTHPYIADIPRFCECALTNQLRFIPKERIMKPESQPEMKKIAVACAAETDQAF